MRGGKLQRRLIDNERTETHRFLAQISSDEIVAARCGIAFVEEQVEHAQHAVDSRRQVVGAWWIDNDIVVSNLSFRANEALRDRRLRREKRAGDLGGAETASRFKRECDLVLDRKRRMATHQDQR
jgi:hypothetical protein